MPKRGLPRVATQDIPGSAQDHVEKSQEAEGLQVSSPDSREGDQQQEDNESQA